MVQSLNTKVDFTTSATSFSNLSSYGKIMLGDKSFEFYHTHDVRKNIQIPWSEVNYIAASVFFKGKWIPRYIVQTKSGTSFAFASREPKRVLKIASNYIGSDRVVHALGFIDAIKKRFKK